MLFTLLKCSKSYGPVFNLKLTLLYKIRLLQASVKILLYLAENMGNQHLTLDQSYQNEKKFWYSTEEIPCLRDMPLKNLTWPSYLILLPLKQHASFQFWCHLSVAHQIYIYNWTKNYKHGSLLLIHTIITNQHYK
jgi:hypothetical protein